jgi:hypothetical protein
MGRRNRRRNRKTNKAGSAVAQTLKRIEMNTRDPGFNLRPQIPDKLPMVLRDKVVTMKRTTTGTNISVSTSSSLFGAASYYLASFDPTSEVAENYQLYRIIELTVHFIPIQGLIVANPGGSGSTSINTGNFETVIDTHNDTTPISHAELQEYKTCQTVATGTPVSRTWTPRTLGRAYGGVTDAFYCMPAGVWLSTDYNDCNYYGIKWAVGQSVVLSGSVYSTRIEAVIQAKNML